MVVPLPSPEDEERARPTAPQAQAVAVGLASGAAPPAGLTGLQRVLLEATIAALTDHPIDLSGYTPITPDELGELLRRRNLAFRTRCIQLMLLAALVLRPLPREVPAKVQRYATALGVDESMVEVAQEFARGTLGLAAIDFERNGYTHDWGHDERQELHTSHALAKAWDFAVADPDLAARWAALEGLPEGTLGRSVWQMYAARGFVYPGLPGSAPPLLAQHDWVHVLADYGTTVECELEVFALIARANDDMHGFSLLAMVVSLFETGYLRSGAGLFEYDMGHLSHAPCAGRAMAERVADAMARGAWCRDEETGDDSVDFLRIDWFGLADMPIEDARARFGLRPRSDRALWAGSVTPWETGGISPFQLDAGRALAGRMGRTYDSFGATPLVVPRP
jgi:hypothetical protein